VGLGFRCTPAASGSVVDSGGVLDLLEAGEQVDEDQRDVGRPGASLLTSISSSSGQEERLDAVQHRRLRVVDDYVVVLQVWTNRECHDMRQRERKGLGEE
jgi:hypothetical protein